jgi:hypothetical protein
VSISLIAMGEQDEFDDSRTHRFLVYDGQHVLIPKRDARCDQLVQTRLFSGKPYPRRGALQVAKVPLSVESLLDEAEQARAGDEERPDRCCSQRDKSERYFVLASGSSNLRAAHPANLSI